MDQTLFNIILGVAGVLGGFLLNAVWQAVKDLQHADKELADKVGKIEVLVAGAYVKRDEFERTIGRLFEKLDQIEMKIDGKADRQ